MLLGRSFSCLVCWHSFRGTWNVILAEIRSGRCNAYRTNITSIDCDRIGGSAFWQPEQVHWAAVGHWRNSGRISIGTVTSWCSLAQSRVTVVSSRYITYATDTW